MGERAPRRGRWGLPGDGGQAALGPPAGGRGEGSQGEGAPSVRPLALGRPEHGAEVGPAQPSSLTPGDPALRRATAALAQATRPSGCVTVTGRLGQRAVEGERGAASHCLRGVVVLCGGLGGSPPSREGWGRAAGAAGRRGAGSQSRSVCVPARACGRGGRAEEDPGLRAGASSGSGPSPGRRPWGSGGGGPAGGRAG